MVAFQAPGAPAKYRLGNEADTYGELIFVNNWLNPRRDPDKAWMKTEVLVEANTTQASNFASNDQFRFREAFVELGNVLASSPGTEFWAGERYSRRLNIDINDFHFLDMSGYGGGMDNLNVKIGRMSLAYLGGAKDDLITNNGIYPKSNLDARLYGVKTPVGELGFWYDYSFSKGGTLADGSSVPSTSGHRCRAYKDRMVGWLQSDFAAIRRGQFGELLNRHRVPTVYLPNAHTFRFTVSRGLSNR
jgi:maltoporin